MNIFNLFNKNKVTRKTIDGWIELKKSIEKQVDKISKYIDKVDSDDSMKRRRIDLKDKIREAKVLFNKTRGIYKRSKTEQTKLLYAKTLVGSYESIKFFRRSLKNIDLLESRMLAKKLSLENKASYLGEIIKNAEMSIDITGTANATNDLIKDMFELESRNYDKEIDSVISKSLDDSYTEPIGHDDISIEKADSLIKKAI